MSTISEYLNTAFADPRQIPAIVEIRNVGRDDLAVYFAERQFTSGVEVGTERGLYAETLCLANPRLKLICVDPYLAYPGYIEHKTQSKIDGLLAEAKERLKPYSVRLLRQPSVDAAARFRNESIDFCYIDGNHTFGYFAMDLMLWWPKVRKGGILAGHDYRRRRKSDRYKVHVVEVVHAFCAAYYLAPLFVLGTKAKVEGEVRDEPRSWMLVKE